MSYFSSRTEFESCLLHFYNETKSCSSSSEEWTWETIPMLKYAFLKKTSFVLSNTRPTPFLEKEGDCMVTEELDPTTATENGGHVEMIQIEHHIVYSTSYQVPVLYFRANYQDGTPLSLEDIQRQIVPEIYHDQVIISQAEHPLLSKPFWYIHPCDTRKLMDAIQFNHMDYIKTWLSFNGPVVKCQISKDLFIQS